MRWTPRSSAWTAGITVPATAAALIAGVPPAAGDIGAELPYACTTASGTRNIGLRVATRTPRAGKVGRPLQLGKITVSLGLSGGAADDFLSADPGASPSQGAQGGSVSTQVSGSLRLAVTVTQNGQTVEAGWPVFAVAGRPGSQGDLRLTGAGVVPPLLPRAPGDVIWSGGELTLTLSHGTSRPASVTCAPEREARLGRVPIQDSHGPGGPAPGGRGSGRPAPKAPAPAGPADPKCVELPGGLEPGGGLNPDKRLAPEPPLFSDVTVSDPKDGVPLCARVAGFTNAKKLGAANPIAAETLIRRGYRTARDNARNYAYQQSYALPLPMPSTGTMLGFGFMPTTATATVEQVATADPKNNFANIASHFTRVSDLPAAFDGGSTVKSFVAVQVKNILVNGIPLDVGARCGTGPTLLVLKNFLGNDHTDRFDPSDGGTYIGTVRIPAFSGCGAGEDLSPLLTASISGGGNVVRLESGKWCPVGSEECDLPREPTTFTVSPGGDVTLTSKPFVITGNEPGAELRCASAAMELNLKKGHWQSRFQLGKVKAATFTGCRRQANGQPSVPQTVTAEARPWTINARAYDAGVLTASLDGLLIKSSGRDGCELRFGRTGEPIDGPPVEMFGQMVGTYSNSTKIWTPVPLQAMTVTPKSHCAHPIPGFIGPDGPFRDPLTLGGPGFAFSPGQKITQP